MKEITLEQASAMSRQQRHRMRLKGFTVPTPPHPRGYKQTPEHIQKRKRFGEDHHSWKGDSAKERTGRCRAERLYPIIGPCSVCGSHKSERHHKDENTLNNSPENIIVLCRKCHMKADGRMKKSAVFLKSVQPLGTIAAAKKKNYGKG